jgi:probable rRNA maturation factor
MHELFNNQRKVAIETQHFRQFIEIIFESVKESKAKSATIVFVSDRKMRELNKQFRGKNSTTDVLSFPFEADEFDLDDNHLGDIIISLEQAQKQANENDLDLELEIKQLILHGVLHLCGYDHETDDGEMNKRELKLRDKFAIN